MPKFGQPTTDGRVKSPNASIFITAPATITIANTTTATATVLAAIPDVGIYVVTATSTTDAFSHIAVVDVSKNTAGTYLAGLLGNQSDTYHGGAWTIGVTGTNFTIANAATVTGGDVVLTCNVRKL